MKLRRGQMLVEVVIAISVAVLAILGLVSVTTKSVNNSAAAKRQVEATTFGTEVMQWIVAQRDISGWNAVAAKATVSGQQYCFPTSLVNKTMNDWPTPGPCVGYQLGSPPGFNRDVTLTLTVPAQEVQVDVVVSWIEGSRLVYSKLSQTLDNY